MCIRDRNITVYSFTVLYTSLWWWRWRRCRPIQRRWNEFKVGGTCQARSAVKIFCRALHFVGFTSTISRFGKRFRVASTVWSLSCFFFFLLSVPPCPVICKSGGTCPRVLGGVSVTFVLQFHTRKHYKTAFQSECIASQGLFPIFVFKITHRVILLTRLCKLLTRVATPSGGHVPQVPQWHDASANVLCRTVSSIGSLPHATTDRRSWVCEVTLLQRSCPTRLRWQLCRWRHCHIIYRRSDSLWIFNYR